MRLPDDNDETRGVTPSVLTAGIVVTLFVIGLFAVVILVNKAKDIKTNVVNNSPIVSPLSSSPEVVVDDQYPDTSEILTGSKLTPGDLDFWDKYPEETEEPVPEDTEPAKDTSVVDKQFNDPATDGKHTLVKKRDGTEEWVLISQYLPANTIDNTRLVLQNGIMKYYEDGKQISYAGVDISKYNSTVDFVKLKKAGIDFVMIKVGARGYNSGQIILDDYFSYNLKNAKDAGLDVGVYFCSQAMSTQEAVEEANTIIDALKDTKITYPVVFDMEYVANDTARVEALNKQDKTTIASDFLVTITRAGYVGMIYGDKEWLINEIDMSKLTAYDVWLAQYEDVPDYPYKFAMWQYSNKGSVDGIAGYVNMNISFIDFSVK